MASQLSTDSQDRLDIRSRNMRFVLGIFMSIVSGLLILLSFPPYDMWWLMWIAFVPMLIAQYRLLPPKWSSLAEALMALFWLGPYLWRLFGADTPMGFRLMGVWIALLNLLLSKQRHFHELTHYRWFILQGAASWVGFELIRTFIPLLATNGFVGYTQASQPWLIQPVSVVSIYGLNLLILLTNYALAQWMMSMMDRRRVLPEVVAVPAESTRKWGMGISLLLLTWVASSILILAGAADDPPTVRVAALQPNFPQPAFQDEINSEQDRLEVFFEQARQAAAAGAQVLFTPEMMFDFDPRVTHTEELRALAAETNTYIFLTYTVTDNTFRNEAVLLTPEGEFQQVYGKNHAFGEPRTPTSGVFPVYDTSVGRLATLICHDANYTDIARKLALNGAQLTAAAFREFGGYGEQLWTNVVFRAVENRTAFVVTGVATISGVIDPYGRLLALNDTPLGDRAVTLADVPLGSGSTVYNHSGDWLGWIALAVYIFFIFLQSRTEKAAKRN